VIDQPLRELFLECHRLFLAKSRFVEAPLDSTAGERPNFRTTQWGLVATASAEGVAEARVALEELYRLYCYPVYAFIRRCGHGRHDAQVLTQDFFVHLLEKGALGRADPQRGRFRNFLVGALDDFLANAAERARSAKRGGGCQWVFLDDDAAEDRYQLAAPEGMTAEKVFEARWAAALIEATFARLRGELESEGKGHLFEALQGFVVGGNDTSYQQVADAVNLSQGAVKTAIHRPSRPLSNVVARRSGTHGRHACGDRRGTSLSSSRAEGVRLRPARPR
jgi:DNA-directed RNA polymerase specialized sigma24 family protein